MLTALLTGCGGGSDDSAMPSGDDGSGGSGSGLTLKVSVTGSGSVSDGGAIACGAACTANYAAGTNVSLTATPGAGYTFSGWGGDCAGTAAKVTIVMNANASCTAQFVTASTLTSGDQKIAVTAPGSGTRHYQLYLPKTFNTPGKTFPLIVALHGDGGSGPGFEGDLGLDAIADGDGGAIVAYPTANTDGSPGGVFDYYDSGIKNDAAFIDQVVAFLQATNKVTPGRVYVTGLSGGGAMINQMLSNNVTTTAWNGVVTHSSSGIWNLNISGSGYPNTKLFPIPSLHVHGLNDTAAYQPDGSGSWISDDWSGITGYWTSSGTSCNAPSAALMTDIGSLPAWDAATTPSCGVLPGCAKTTVWCPIPGMTHALWNQAGKVTWKFFSQLP